METQPHIVIYHKAGQLISIMCKNWNILNVHIIQTVIMICPVSCLKEWIFADVCGGGFKLPEGENNSIEELLINIWQWRIFIKIKFNSNFQFHDNNILFSCRDTVNIIVIIDCLVQFYNKYERNTFTVCVLL